MPGDLSINQHDLPVSLALHWTPPSISTSWLRFWLQSTNHRMRSPRRSIGHSVAPSAGGLAGVSGNGRGPRETRDDLQSRRGLASANRMLDGCVLNQFLLPLPVFLRQVICRVLESTMALPNSALESSSSTVQYLSPLLYLLPIPSHSSHHYSTDRHCQPCFRRLRLGVFVTAYWTNSGTPSI